MTILSKDTVREEALRHRDRIDPASESAEDAAAIFMDVIAPEPGHIVSLYWPKGREFDTTPLMDMLMKARVTVALPVVVKGDRLLRFVAWTDGDALEPGSFGIMEPPVNADTVFVEPDVFVVPLLAFDRRGHRMGYGMGHYDETLRRARASRDIVAVGYAYGQQAVLFNLPAEDHDQMLDWIVTPQKAQRFASEKNEKTG